MRLQEINEAIAVGKLSIKNLLLSGKSIKQAFVDLQKGKISRTKGPVAVVASEGQYALLDGYHRLLQAILRGEKHIRGKRDASLGLYYAIPKDPWVFDPNSPTYGLEVLGISAADVQTVSSSLSVNESLLIERSALDGNVNSLARPISGDPAAFWAWFGKSKVKDKQGRPLVVFHGTDSDFSKFDPTLSNANTNTGVPRGAFVFSDHAGVASSYSAAQFDVHGWRDPKITAAFRELLKTGSFDDQMAFLEKHPAGYDDYKDGGNVMPVYLRMVKPLVVDAKGWNWNEVYWQPKGYRSPESFSTNEIATIAKEEGYDGCIIKNVKDVNKGPHHIGTTFFVFSPNQIKSAISGTKYRPDSDDIQEDAIEEMAPAAATILPTHNHIMRAREFALKKWKERAQERGSPEPADLSYSCKFTSLFAQKLFGGKIKGSWDHQYLELPDGMVIDLNIDAEDVRALGDKAHTHDPSFFRGNHDWRDSMQSIKPRVNQWVKEFRSTLNEGVLTEGLIAIPPKMHEHIDFMLTFNMLWKMRDLFRGKEKKLPEHYAEFKKLVKAFGEEIPRERYPTDKNVFVWSIPVKLDGMPPTYAHLNPRVKNISFAIDWRPGRSVGGWLPTKDVLIVYPMSVEYLTRYPSERSHPEDLKLALEVLRETITHELRHMVQGVILHDHPEQRATKADYQKHGSDYFTSPVEFDPTIGSAVHEFLELWTEYGKKNPAALSKAVKQFTAMAPSGVFDTFHATKFFLSLKKVSPIKHKVAAAKFFKELKSRL